MSFRRRFKVQIIILALALIVAYGAYLRIYPINYFATDGIGSVTSIGELDSNLHYTRYGESASDPPFNGGYGILDKNNGSSIHSEVFHEANILSLYVMQNKQVLISPYSQNYFFMANSVGRANTIDNSFHDSFLSDTIYDIMFDKLGFSYQDGQIVFYEPNDMLEFCKLNIAPDRTTELFDVVFSENSIEKLLYDSWSDGPKLFIRGEPDQSVVFVESKRAYLARFIDDDKVIIASGNEIRIYDESANQLDLLSNVLVSNVFTGADSIFFVDSSKNINFIYGFESLDQYKFISKFSAFDSPSCIALSNDRKTLYIGSQNGYIYFYDLGKINRQSPD